MCGLGGSLVAPTFDDVGDNEEVLVQEELDTEVEPLKTAPDPGQPTKRQVEEHRTQAHIPYRSWCRWCNLGRGRGMQHRSREGSLIPIVGLDYFFLTEGGVKLRKELEMSDEEIAEARGKGELVKCLIVRCMKTKAVFAHVVPCKGDDEAGAVVDMVIRDVQWLGHARLILKADNEPALQALVRRALEMAKVECKDLEQVSKEDSPAYDSQANGGIEVGVQIVRGMLRTLKLCLEQRIDKHMPVSHPVVAWLLEHACLVVNALVRGTDGMTAWMRVRGRAFGQQMVGFGESVLFRYPSKGPRHAPHGNVGPLGGDGVFLGYDRSSSTFIVFTAEGIVAARSITRKPESDRWCPEFMAQVDAMPNEPRSRLARARVRFEPEATDRQPTTVEAAPCPGRQMRISKSDLDEYGYDADCTQCKYMVKYGKSKPGTFHSKECRKRLMEAMRQTDAGRDRLKRFEERLTKSMSEYVEWKDKHGQIDEPGPAAAPMQPARRARSFLDRAPSLAEPSQQASSSRRAASGDAAPERPAVDMPARPMSKPEAATDTSRDEVTAPTPAEETPAPHAVPDQEEVPVAPNVADAEMDADPATSNGDVEMDFVGHLSTADGIGSLEPSVEDFVAELLIGQMGGTSRKHRRETNNAARRMVSEIYSPPRVTQRIRDARVKHVMPGFAYDLTVLDPDDGQPWDFSLASKREKARAKVREQKPYVLIGSPMCTHFSTWQRLNEAKSRDVQAMRRAKAEATVHIDFVASLYEEQIAAGRYFLHEHPLYASSWTVPSMAKILQQPGVVRVHADQCQFGAEIKHGEQHKSRPQIKIKKPTGFMTNAPRLAKALEIQCSGRGGSCSRLGGSTHQLCSGRHCAEAAVYPRGLCRAVLRGIRDQLRHDGLLKDGCYGIQAPDEDAEVERHLRGPEQGYSGKCRDDLTGQTLKDSLVEEARAKELSFFHSKKVWTKVPKSQARAKSGRGPISVRWVDVNKGDDMVPNYRSRLVARQLKAHDVSGQNYFAPAPPLEALRTVLSMAMTRVGSHRPDWDPASPTRTQISMVDVKRAYFNATIDPEDAPTYVQLPAEDPEHESMCARLLRHMYGTRAAADGWQEEYSTLLVSLGFRQGDASPNVFHHAERAIVTSVHGDDFTSCGPADSLDWLEAEMAHKYELTISPRMGPGPQDAKEGRVLNRVIRWCDGRLEYECDPRQIERLVAECGLTGAKPAATPGVKPTFKELTEDNSELPGHLTTAFRGAAARGNYLAADRVDVQFACKEVCRWMSKPTAQAWQAMKRICRYLLRAPRLVYEFPQQSIDALDVYVDTDWAGCPKTRKSTSGGCVMVGRHAVKHWSSTQASISLSSGEAEFAGVIRGAGQGLGYQALLRDVGVELPLRVWTDSSAAIGICSRQGLGKLRHLDTHTLWVQQAVRTKRIDLRKVPGERNPADLLTKHSISRQHLEELVSLYGCKHLEGRADSAPLLRKGASSRMTMADAAGEIANIQPGAHQRGPCAAMPHVGKTGAELDESYPSLASPEEDELEDVADDRADAVYQHGLAIAETIRRESQEHGRRKRPIALLRAGEQRRRRRPADASQRPGQVESWTTVSRGAVATGGPLGDPPAMEETNKPWPGYRRRSDKGGGSRHA